MVLALAEPASAGGGLAPGADEALQLEVDVENDGVGSGGEPVADADVIFDPSRLLPPQGGKEVMLLVAQRGRLVDETRATVEFEAGEIRRLRRYCTAPT